MLCEFKKSTEKVGLRIHPQKTKILSNQCPSIRKEIEIDDIKVEILTRRDSTKYLGQMITFQQQETTEIRNRIRAAWATSQVQTGTDIEKLPAQTSTLAIRRTDKLRGCATHQEHGHPQKEHERMLQSVQRKMLRLIVQTKRRYKKIVKHKVKTSEEKCTNDLGSTGDGSEDGQSSNTHKDQDSDVSFENDTAEEIDTTEIEKEDWIEYTRRSTN